MKGTSLSKEQLTCLISKSWKTLDDETLNWVTMLSKIEKQRVSEKNRMSSEEGELSRSLQVDVKAPEFKSRGPPKKRQFQLISTVDTQDSSCVNASVLPTVSLQALSSGIYAPGLPPISNCTSTLSSTSTPPDVPIASSQLPTSICFPRTNDDWEAAAVLTNLERFTSDSSSSKAVESVDGPIEI